MSSIIAGRFFGLPELVIAMVLVILLVIEAIPAILAYIVLSRIPEQHRKQSPGLVFLLLIPLFSVIWAFFVHPRVAESLKSYYDSLGANLYGDCGKSLALWLCICSVCVFVPFLGMFAGLAALVLLILFYVRAFDLSSKIPKSA